VGVTTLIREQFRRGCCFETSQATPARPSGKDWLVAEYNFGK
jgi:hypothetical protein